MEKDKAAAFFSYCREDATFALRLAEDLKAGGANVWLDQLDIKPGQEWDKAIEVALTSAPRMLVILTPASVQSRNVQNEIIFAVNKKKTIIPVLCRDCDVPMQLLGIQYKDLRTDYACGIKALIKILGVEQPPEVSTPTCFGVDKEDQSNMTESQHHEPARQVGTEEEQKPSGTSSGIRFDNRFASLGDLLLTRAQLPSLEEQLTDANSIDMSGMSLLALAKTYRSMLLKKIKQGCKLRLLLLNPANDNLMQMIAPFIRSYTVTDHTAAIRESLKTLQGEAALSNSPLVHIRLYDYPLAHAMLIINRDTLDARLRVEMYMCSSMPADCPGFYILKRHDPDWFSTFADEFDDHWAKAQPYLNKMGIHFTQVPPIGCGLGTSPPSRTR
jgi:hypothetical protein